MLGFARDDSNSDWHKRLAATVGAPTRPLWASFVAAHFDASWPRPNVDAYEDMGTLNPSADGVRRP